MKKQGELFQKDSVIAAQMNQPKELTWNIPVDFPDLTHHKQIAIDLETCDPNLTTLGPGWVRKDGYVVGIAVAAGDWEGYFPIRHANGHNMDACMFHEFHAWNRNKRFSFDTITNDNFIFYP